jgi:hypothetical protein
VRVQPGKEVNGMENIDIGLKAIALLSALIGVFQLVRQIGGSRVVSHRSNYAFVQEYITQTKSNPHPLLVEMGYRAIYPHSNLGAPEILYVLSFPQPSRAFQLYQWGRDYLEFVEGVPDSSASVGYGESHKNGDYRNFLKATYFFLYFVLAMIAFAPLVFFGQLLAYSLQIAGTLTIFCLVVFGPFAALCLRRYSSVLSAERFVDIQKVAFGKPSATHA